MTYKAQSQMILEYMAQGHRISPLEALNKFGCLRLGARIYDLKNEGHNIITEIVSENGKRYARYTLIKMARKVA